MRIKTRGVRERGLPIGSVQCERSPVHMQSGDRTEATQGSWTFTQLCVSLCVIEMPCGRPLQPQGWVMMAAIFLKCEWHKHQGEQLRKAIPLIDAAVRLWGQTGLNTAACRVLLLLLPSILHVENKALLACVQSIGLSGCRCLILDREKGIATNELFYWTSEIDAASRPSTSVWDAHGFQLTQVNPTICLSLLENNWWGVGGWVKQTQDFTRDCYLCPVVL